MEPAQSPELEFALDVAQGASEITLQIFDTGFKTEFKDKHRDDPVTTADKAANEYIVSEIRRRFPGDRIVAEESGAEGLATAGRTWFIDPIDGTKEFVNKTDEWSVMIGLVENGRPVLGVVAHPRKKRIYFAARGQGAYVKTPEGTQRLQTNAIESPQDAVLATSRTHKDPKQKGFVRHLGISKFQPHGSVGLKMALIAEGRSDLYFNFSRKCSLWDLAAGEAILEEAGGTVRDLKGKPIDYSGDPLVEEFYFASAATLAPAVIESMKTFRHPNERD